MMIEYSWSEMGIILYVIGLVGFFTEIDIVLFVSL